MSSAEQSSIIFRLMVTSIITEKIELAASCLNSMDLIIHIATSYVKYIRIVYGSAHDTLTPTIR